MGVPSNSFKLLRRWSSKLICDDKAQQRKEAKETITVTNLRNMACLIYSDKIVEVLLDVDVVILQGY